MKYYGAHILKSKVQTLKNLGKFWRHEIWDLFCLDFIVHLSFFFAFKIRFLLPKI